MYVICAECGERCTANIVDNGIGPNEYWGAKGNHSVKDVESNCCDAECVDENGIEITVNDFVKFQDSERDYYE